jgi:O-Antigen ligase
VTTTLRPAPGGSSGWPDGGPPDTAGPGRPLEIPRARQALGRLAANPAWPVTALLIGYPIWWALGIADFMWILLPIPMALRMLAWWVHGSRPLRVPPGFGIWLLFLVCAAAGLAVLTLTAPGTVASPVSHRVLSYGDRTLNYVGVTVLLLYAGNLTERELTRRRFAWMLGLVAVFTTIGGLAGMVAPHLQFNSPFLLVLPKSVQANTFIQASVHPGLAQLQNVLGTVGGRPKAPFDYTNTWGECLSILVPWLLVGWYMGGTRRQRRIVVAAVALSIIPLLYSLDRGVWIGVVVALIYLAVRLAAKGRVAPLGGLFAVVALVGILVLVTPLQSVFSSRLQHGKSNNLRSKLSSLAVDAAIASPIIGYGDTRQEKGSPQSISVGPSPKCPSCGQLAVGSTGQLWLLLVCDGFVGAALYLGFFGYGIWRYRHDRTPYGIAGVLVLLLSFVYMFTYDAVGAPLGFTMLAYALLWKSNMTQQDADPADARRARPGRLSGRARVPAVNGRPPMPEINGGPGAPGVTAGGVT